MCFFLSLFPLALVDCASAGCVSVSITLGTEPVRQWMDTEVNALIGSLNHELVVNN
jgi:hypothetical protein